MATRPQMLAARERRIARYNVRVEWLGEQLMRRVQLGMIHRLKVTCQLLRDKIVINLGIPVVKTKIDGVTRVDPTSRSQPGEFPRADTTRLMKTIFAEVDADAMIGRVGTPLDYGLYLEIHMDRSFLRRTLFEEAQRLGVILGSPGGGPAGPLLAGHPTI